MREAKAGVEEDDPGPVQGSEELPLPELKAENRPTPQIVALGANRSRIVGPAEHEERTGANFGRYQGI
jgi:hypothetical protein